ncbi:hypothetical protein EZV62_009747 [Acer yangbiense]|uniref:SWIM-type domain-containing protein n=1 Tax=Acer yangbiense TaxID=1000413 RepID=A0A5C7HZU8_9ROSI|nr:hypothetical protein EZV62_009747 [Acer yangbiense]
MQEGIIKKVHRDQPRISEDVRYFNRVYSDTKISTGPSYAEVVKSSTRETKPNGLKEKDRIDRMEFLKWDVDAHDSSWLQFCAVGVLKSFSDITPVVRGLREDGYKLLLFTEVIRILYAITPQSRLSWIELRGIPLNCWCDDFFKSLGWMVEESLTVEEETLNRSKLNCGRVLVLIPTSQSCPGSIKVVTGNASFQIKVREDLNPINSNWISKWLGIGKGKYSDSLSFGRDNLVDIQGIEEEDRVANLKKTINCKAGFNEDNMIGGFKKQKGAGGGLKKVIIKGKGIMRKNMYHNQNVPLIHNGNLVLDKNRDSKVGKVWTSDDNGSSFFVESEESQFLKHPIIIGESSKYVLSQLKGGNIVIDLGNGLDQEKNSKNSSSGNSFSHISETLFHQSATEEEDHILTMGRERKKASSKRIAKSCSSMKSHGMKTRKDKSLLKRGVQEIVKEDVVPSLSRGRWNLEEEVTKVIEKGVALGYFNCSLPGQNSGTGTTVYVNETADLDIIEPGDCSVISLINDAKKKLKGDPIEPWEKWQLAITLPWNGVRHVLTTDEQLMCCFKEFDRCDKPTIEFELILVPNDMEFPVDLLAWKEGFIVEDTATEPVEDIANEPVEDTSTELDEDAASEPVEDAVSDEFDGSEDDNYEVVDESEDDSDVSLVDEGGLDFANPDRCDPDGDDSIVILSSDEENGLTRAARYCRDNQWAPNPNGTIAFEDGQIIGNAKMTRAAVKMYAIQEGFTLKKVKNDKCRYTVVCKNDACDWRLHASCLTDGVTFMIKSVRGGHSMCPRVAENKEATSRWVSSVLKSLIQSNPKGKGKFFKNELQERYAVKVGNQTVYRAKRIVLENLKSDHAKAYAKIRKYGNVIRVMNLGSDVYVALNPDVVSVNPTFFRFYLSFKACKIGFKNGCRPLIGVDGCHLTGQFGGVLLSATALDGDSGIVPIALCICESETTESWTWFLRLLRESLEWEEGRPICFISDRQKGGLAAISKEWPEASNRVANRGCFDEAMAAIRSENAKAADWMMSEPVERWARHGFDPRIKSDHITNNMSECFNSWIKDERDKPVLQLLEHFRRRIMVRFCEKWEEVEKFKDSITPYAKEMLDTNEKEARKLQVIHGRGEWYETVDKYGKKFIVSVADVMCDCGMWQMSGLPCMHAIAVFMWPDYQHEIIEPPVKRTKVGRPKKNRKRATHEPRAPALFNN